MLIQDGPVPLGHGLISTDDGADSQQAPQALVFNVADLALGNQKVMGLLCKAPDGQIHREALCRFPRKGVVSLAAFRVSCKNRRDDRAQFSALPRTQELHGHAMTQDMGETGQIRTGNQCKSLGPSPGVRKARNQIGHWIRQPVAALQQTRLHNHSCRLRKMAPGLQRRYNRPRLMETEAVRALKPSWERRVAAELFQVRHRLSCQLQGLLGVSCVKCSQDAHYPCAGHHAQPCLAFVRL